MSEKGVRRHCLRDHGRHSRSVTGEADFSRLEQAARKAANGDLTRAYAPWLAAKGAGLKAQAKTALGAFMAIASTWPQDHRRAFVRWLDEASDDLDDRRAMTAHPVMTGLVLPTLKDWAATEPDDPWPHILLGRFHDWTLDDRHPERHFRAALMIAPDMIEARRGVAQWLLDIVERNQHHLPEDYLGDRAADTARMEEVIQLSAGLPDPDEAERLRRRALRLRGHATGEIAGEGLTTYGISPAT